MNKRNALYMFIISFFGVMLLVHLTTDKTLVDVQEYDVFITVGKFSGFNVNNSAFYFGTIAPGGVSRRFTYISHTFAEDLMVDIEPSGEIGDWIGFSSDHFVLKSSQRMFVELTANVPQTATYGDYTGKVKVYFRTVTKNPS